VSVEDLEGRRWEFRLKYRRARRIKWSYIFGPCCGRAMLGNKIGYPLCLERKETWYEKFRREVR